MVSHNNASEAAIVADDVCIYAANHLLEVIAHLQEAIQYPWVFQMHKTNY